MARQYGARSSATPQYHEAHALTISIYNETRNFPRDEWFGIRAQVRRAAVSIASNIVEGNLRRSTPEYVNFLNIARGSAAEGSYLVRLATELDYLSAAAGPRLERACDQLIPQLEALIQRMELLMRVERARRTSEPAKTKD